MHLTIFINIVIYETELFIGKLNIIDLVESILIILFKLKGEKRGEDNILPK